MYYIHSNILPVKTKKNQTFLHVLLLDQLPHGCGYQASCVLGCIWCVCWEIRTVRDSRPNLISVPSHRLQRKQDTDVYDRTYEPLFCEKRHHLLR